MLKNYCSNHEQALELLLFTSVICILNLELKYEDWKMTNKQKFHVLQKLATIIAYTWNNGIIVENSLPFWSYLSEITNKCT